MRGIASHQILYMSGCNTTVSKSYGRYHISFKFNLPHPPIHSFVGLILKSTFFIGPLKLIQV